MPILKSHWLVALALLLCSMVLAAAADGLVPSDMRSRGGLCVMIGNADDLAPARELAESGPWVIHVLDARASVVDQAREELQREGVYGRVSVEHWTAENLPYADNLVNLIVLADPGHAFDREEALRALAPGGRAVLAIAEGLDTLELFRPDEMSDWAHPWGGADGNLASPDRAFGVPNDYQWIAGPPVPMADRKSSAGVILNAGGRTFSITQNVAENLDREGGPNYLVARDAFNGTLLWSREWKGPTTSFFRGFHEAIVADADRLYTANDDGVAILDAGTGEEVETWPLGNVPGKLLLAEGVLLAQCSDGFTAFDAADGGELWSRTADVSRADISSALARDGRVFSLVGVRQEDGQWQHDVLALDLRNGEERWRSPVEGDFSFSTPQLRLHFAGEGMVCLIERTNLRALCAEDGRQLWHRETGAQSRGASFDSRQAGHFFVNGKVWVRQTQASAREEPELWVALDPLTGEDLREVEATGAMAPRIASNKQACAPLTATERFVIDGRLATVWDFETGAREGFKFVRGGCQVGVITANGLGYVPPNACGCLTEQLSGFIAVVHSEDAGMRSHTPGEVQRGPAWDRARPAGGSDSEWPMYRRDGTRGAYMPGSIPAQLGESWHADVATATEQDQGEWRLRIGRPLTPPVVAGGLVLLAEPTTHQVIALDERTGSERWRFTAGGRVTIPPTVHGGLALFGAHDGYVYALDMADGQLVWRRRAAPSDRRIMAYGQLESSWPVVGGVLMHEGKALVSAGRAPDAGGGPLVHALDPFTGDLHWSRRVEGATRGTAEPLVTDGKNVYLMDKRLDIETGEVADADGGARYLRGGKWGLLDISWTRLELVSRPAKQLSTWLLGGRGGEPGQIMAFNDNVSFSFFLNSPASEGGGYLKAATENLYRQSLPRQGWRFRTDPEDRGQQEEWFAADHDETGWRDDIETRRNWQSELEEPYVGVAWYRYTTDLPEFSDHDSALLSIQRTADKAWVWVNGEFVGKGSHKSLRPHKEQPLELEVKGAIRPGESNQFTIRVENSNERQGGLWRAVVLRILSAGATWDMELPGPEQVEALFMTDDAFFVAGPKDRAFPEGPGFLRLLDYGEGRELTDLSLPASPVHDGLAAANGRVFVVLRNGQVVCLEAQ